MYSMFGANADKIPFEAKDLLDEDQSLKPAKKKKKMSHPSNAWNRMRKLDGGTAAVLFTMGKNGKIEASQYQTDVLLETPELSRPLIFSASDACSPIKTGFGNVQQAAYSPGGTEYNSRRSVDITYRHKDKKTVKAELRFFSPKKDKEGKKRNDFFIEDETNVNPNFSKISAKNRRTLLEELNHEMPLFKKAKSVVHGEGESYIIPTKKAHDRKVLITNKTVWKGKSARHAMLDFIEESKDKYDEKQLTILKKLAMLYKMEWTHRIGVSLAPKLFDPQTQKNMGSASKVSNTRMMPLEYVATHYAFNGLGDVTVESTFKMLDKIISEIFYSVTINTVDSCVKASMTFSAIVLPNRENWPCVSDKRLLREFIGALLIGMKPTITTHFPAPKKSLFSELIDMVYAVVAIPGKMKLGRPENMLAL